MKILCLQNKMFKTLRYFLSPQPVYEHGGCGKLGSSVVDPKRFFPDPALSLFSDPDPACHQNT
jgi:hypothetical protein